MGKTRKLEKARTSDSYSKKKSHRDYRHTVKRMLQKGDVVDVPDFEDIAYNAKFRMDDFVNDGGDD